MRSVRASCAVASCVGPLRVRSDGRVLKFLLLPADEDQLRLHLTNDLELVPLADAAEPGTPDLPSHSARGRPGPPSEFVYWAKEVGPLQHLGDAPGPTNPKEKVARILNQQDLGDDWVSAIDVARSPVIRFYRSSWNRNGCLNPGLLQAAAAPVKEQPGELLRLRRQVERWLQDRR